MNVIFKFEYFFFVHTLSLTLDSHVALLLKQRVLFFREYQYETIFLNNQLQFSERKKKKISTLNWSNLKLSYMSRITQQLPFTFPHCKLNTLSIKSRFFNLIKIYMLNDKVFTICIFLFDSSIAWLNRFYFNQKLLNINPEKKYISIFTKFNYESYSELIKFLYWKFCKFIDIF